MGNGASLCASVAPWFQPSWHVADGVRRTPPPHTHTYHTRAEMHTNPAPLGWMALGKGDAHWVLGRQRLRQVDEVNDMISGKTYPRSHNSGVSQVMLRIGVAGWNVWAHHVLRVTSVKGCMSAFLEQQ
jgi:hypothetical protein